MIAHRLLRIHKIPIRAFCSTNNTNDTDLLDGVVPVKLAYGSFETTKSMTSEPPVIICHGLFGSKSNWKSLSKAIVERTGLKVFAVDTRNHGDSPRTEEMSMFSMAADLELFLQDQHLPHATFMGHSLGGRAVMALALTRPKLVNRLVVVDVSPSRMPVTTREEVKAAMLAMDESLEVLDSTMNIAVARKTADKSMQRTIKDHSLRQFLLSNLRKGESEYEYQPYLKTIRNSLEQLLQMPPICAVYERNALFVRGALSQYIRDEDLSLIKKIFPRAELKTVANAGHWVHADKPVEFMNVLTEFLGSSKQQQAVC